MKKKHHNTNNHDLHNELMKLDVRARRIVALGRKMKFQWNNEFFEYCYNGEFEASAGVYSCEYFKKLMNDEKIKDTTFKCVEKNVSIQQSGVYDKVSFKSKNYLTLDNGLKIIKNQHVLCIDNTIGRIITVYKKRNEHKFAFKIKLYEECKDNTLRAKIFKATNVEKEVNCKQVCLCIFV